MTTRRTRARVLAAAALAAASAFAAAPAEAAGATHSVGEVDFVAPRHLADVCGFPVELHVQGTFNVVSFTDDDGDLVKEIRNFRFRGTLTANDVTIEGLSMGPEIWTYAEDGSAQVAAHGVVHRRVPRQGTVTLFAGYQVTSIDGEVEVVLDSAGAREDAAQLCAVFAP